MIPDTIKISDSSFRPNVSFTNFYKNVIYIKISHWSIEPDTKNWNYYLYLKEGYMPDDVFESIWLKDKDKGTWVTHDYYDNNYLNSLDIHGGITFYEKRGHTKGHRTVVIGCDYAHLYDREHGDYDIKEIIYDAMNSAEDAIMKLSMKRPIKNT